MSSGYWKWACDEISFLCGNLVVDHRNVGAYHNRIENERKKFVSVPKKPFRAGDP